MGLSNALKAGFVEALLEELEEECEPATEDGTDEAEAVFMSGCDILLFRESDGEFTLTIDHKGTKCAVTLTASLDASGDPKLSAIVS